MQLVLRNTREYAEKVTNDTAGWITRHTASQFKPHTSVPQCEPLYNVDTFSAKMDVRRLEIIEKLNYKSRVSDNGQCIMWTGCCKARRVRYGVMCINVSLHGPGVWRCVAVHRLALMKTPTNFSLNDVLNAQGGASHLCHNALCINAAHISLEPHWVNNKRWLCTRTTTPRLRWSVSIGEFFTEMNCQLFMCFKSRTKT